MELSGITTQLLLFLFCAAFVAGFLDTLAGGGGLIALPALLMTGIPPLFALGTNKLQGTIGTATATYMMLRMKKVRWHEVRSLMFAAFAGAASGTVVVQFVNVELLSLVIPAVLLLIAIYFLFSPQPRIVSGNALMPENKYRRCIVPLIGCYDGIFGPGTGSFFALAGVSLRGLGLINATVVAKTLNFSTNIASLIIFLFAGKIVWGAGLVMMGGQLAGAWCAANCLFKINPQHLRFIVVLMCLGMLAKYAFSSGLI